MVRAGRKFVLSFGSNFSYTVIMKKSITVKRKSVGRPPTGVDPLVGVRFPKQTIAKIDAFAKLNDISRSEAVRRLLDQALNA